jgi:hypothetical protein
LSPPEALQGRSAAASGGGEQVVYVANELRNKISHTFEQAKIKAKMDALGAHRSMATWVSG